MYQHKVLVDLKTQPLQIPELLVLSLRQLLRCTGYVVYKNIELALGRHFRVELAYSAGGGVARVGKKRKLFVLSLSKDIYFFQSRLAHPHLALDNDIDRALSLS